MNRLVCLLRRRRHGRDARDTMSFLCALCVFAAHLFATDPPKKVSSLDGGTNDVYKFESLPDPEESKGLEVGAMGWTAAGELALWTRRWELWMRSASRQYERVASG